MTNTCILQVDLSLFRFLSYGLKMSRGLLALLLAALMCRTESRCSPTSYYKNCWIRHFPGVLLDTGESERRGARLVRSYREESALGCSRSCCLTTNVSCNVAIFDYAATWDNCLHLHCPTLDSCIVTQRHKVVLYKLTHGVDPDLLVFEKHLTSSVGVLPHHFSRINASEALPASDKRQFFHPPPPATVKPPVKTPPAETSTTFMASPSVTVTTAPPASLSTDRAPTSTSTAQTSVKERGSPTPTAEDMKSSGLGEEWQSLLVALLSCGTMLLLLLLLSCCCRRGGRGYQGSMRLMKYNVVKENS
ncbi:MANSC domain-containing protein 4-like [Nerophis ophidion]|uniref:MANSC domain-containing protein 4-like n=1 Tax=Nerophis ophidion TaxID=159077 RepID=UPI002AE04A61|nr:MANSC domain-containing protein 4-like [Nerophis ophidion]